MNSYKQQKHAIFHPNPYLCKDLSFDGKKRNKTSHIPHHNGCCFFLPESSNIYYINRHTSLDGSADGVFKKMHSWVKPLGFYLDVNTEKTDETENTRYWCDPFGNFYCERLYKMFLEVVSVREMQNGRNRGGIKRIFVSFYTVYFAAGKIFVILHIAVIAIIFCGFI